MFLAALHFTPRRYTDPTDHPYIHPASARSIWHGHHEINKGEAPAPSFSILWPFLLAAFSVISAAFEYASLAINPMCIVIRATDEAIARPARGQWQ